VLSSAQVTYGKMIEIARAVAPARAA